MERNRIIAIACAVIAALCVIVAGKSCTDDINRTNKRNRSSQPTASQSSEAETETASEQEQTDSQSGEEEETAPVEYDLFGREITTSSEATSEETTDSSEAEPETDEFGEPVTASEEEDEQATEGETAPPVISGFNHGEYDEEGNTIPEKPTLPPDFTLIIE